MTPLHNICPTGICVHFNTIYIVNCEIKHITERDKLFMDHKFLHNKNDTIITTFQSYFMMIHILSNVNILCDLSRLSVAKERRRWNMDWRVGSVGSIILTKEKESTQGKPGPNASLSTKNPTWTALILVFEILRALLIKIFILLGMCSCILVYKCQYFLNLKIQIFWDVALQTVKFILKFRMTITPSSCVKKYFSFFLYVPPTNVPKVLP